MLAYTAGVDPNLGEQPRPQHGAPSPTPPPQRPVVPTPFSRQGQLTMRDEPEEQEEFVDNTPTPPQGLRALE
ncbi:MAG: hypothetical protein ACRDRL_27575, partial [Sciscionella sp.]